MEYIYISEPKKPLFSVGKALIALLIIIFNFWSFDVFAANTYVFEYECSRDSDGVGVGMTSTRLSTVYIGIGSTNIANAKAPYKIISADKVACLLTDEPEDKPDIITDPSYFIATCNDNNPLNGTSTSISSWISSIFSASDTDIVKTLTKSYISGRHGYNSKEYKFRADYNFVNNIDDQKVTTPTIIYACDITGLKYEEIGECDYGLRSIDMVPTSNKNWSLGSFVSEGVSYGFKFETDELITYACDLNKEYEDICHDINPLAAPQFSSYLIRNYPKYSDTLQMEFQGCLYDVLLTNDLDNKWDGECYNATFYRTDVTASDGSVTNVDFSQYSCVEKTCSSNQELDSQGICQNIDNSDISPLSSAFKLVTCKIFNSQNSGELDCPQLNSFYSSYSASLSSAQSYIVNNVIDKDDFGSSYSKLLVKTSNAETYYIQSNSTLDSSSVEWVKGRVTTHEYMRCGNTSTTEYALLNSDTICNKICPSGVVVDYNSDCAATVQQCPDGSELPINHNCSTKICPDGSEIQFDLICANDSGDDSGSGSGLIEEDYVLFKDYLVSPNNPSLEENPSETHVGFYELEYPNGFDDVLVNNQESFDNSEFSLYLEKWDLSANGSIPDLNFCFDLGSIGNLGCHELLLDNNVFAFMRVILIITSLFASRFIVFGG